MTLTEYRRLLKPAQDKAISLLMDMEKKHGDGITLDPCKDALKCSRHAISSELEEDNPDGSTHAVAALVRAYKIVLAEG